MHELALLIDREHRTLPMAMKPSVKIAMRLRVQRLEGVPTLTEADVTQAMNDVQNLFEYHLKSLPDGKLALLVSLILFCGYVEARARRDRPSVDSCGRSSVPCRHDPERLQIPLSSDHRPSGAYERCGLPAVARRAATTFPSAEFRAIAQTCELPLPAGR